MDEAQVSGSSFVRTSVNDQPPVPAIPQKNRELKRAVSPLDFSFLPSTELDRSRTSPGTRNLGFTTDRSGKIVQSGTLRRAATNMNSLSRNKSSDQLVLQASTPSSQSPTILSGTLNKNVMSNGQDGRLTVTDNGASRKAASLDRSWRTKEADLRENLPQVGGTFSFDLERDVQVLLDLISTFEENVVDSRRLNSTPSSPGFFEGGQMTVIRRKTQQKSSSGESLSPQRVACDVPGFDEKPVMHQKDAFGSPGFNKTPTGNQTPHPEFDEASVKSQKVDAGLQESNKTFHKVATGASNIHTTPNRSQELPYGNTEIDQTSGFYKKFSVADDDPPGYPVYSSSSKGILNGALLSPEAGNNGVLYNHRAGQVLRLPSTPGVHMGVSAQRGYASDSEDPMDWLQQQRAKLKLKLFRQGGTKLDPRLLQELKIRQKILGRTPVDEKDSVSSDGAQTSKLPAQSPELYYGEYGRRDPTPDSSTAWSDSYSPRQNYDPGVRGSDGRAGTPDFDQNRGGHFATETQSPDHGCRSPLTLPTYANGVPLSNCPSFSSTVCENPRRATDTNSESAKGTNNIGPSSDQREVHETCISKKIIHQHRGYSPTRLDALIDAAAVTPDCESSPSSSQSTEISDSGYRTASASSTNDESPLTNTGQKLSSSSVQEVPMNKNGQAGVDHFNMAQPNSRHHVTSVDSSSKINERFNAQSRPPATVAYQFEIPGTVHTQPWSPAAHSQQYFTTSPQRPTFAQTVVTSGVSHNAPNPNRSKTLEEEIEDLMALGEQLKVERRPIIESQIPLQDQRRPFVGIQEPFVYTSGVKSSSDVSYQHPIHITEAQRQMLRLTGNQIPASSIDNPVLNSRQPMNGNLPIYQTVRTTTGVDLPTETRMFNQLHVETYQPNRMLAEPSYQRKETQTTNGGVFNPNLGKPSGLRDQELFVLQPTPLNYHTLPNNAARHETVNMSRSTEQQHPANQPFAGDCNRPWNAEQDTVKYATTVQVDRTQPSGKPANVNAFPNHTGSSGQEFQGRKTAGSESAIGYNGFDHQSSVFSGNEPPRTSEGNDKRVLLYSNDGRQVLVPQSYIDSTMASTQSILSRGAIPEHRVENSVSGRVVNNVAQDSRITQQQVGQRVDGAGGQGQMIDRYGLTAPDSNTIRRQVHTGPVQQQQQPFGATRVENIRSGSVQAQVHSPNDAMQRAPFYSQNSDSVFGSPPPAAVSMNQVVAHLRGEVSRTSSFSSSVTGQSSPSLSVDRSSGGSASSNRVVDGVDVSPHYVMQCVRDAYKEWYKPEISRDDVVNFLKDKPPGSFIIRNSTSYAGDFALAVKVAEIPAQIQQKTGDMSEEFVRHFLIESKPSGIRLKGRSNEPVFASLTSFVFQHALTPLSLPHRLLLPISTETSSAGSGTGSLSRSSSSTNPSKAQDEISSMLIYIGAVDLETLTGPEGLEKAVSHIEVQKTSPVTTTVVNFILSSQGIVLTDTKRKLFFRRHYPLSCISYCGIDRGERRWTEDVDGSKKNTDRRIFGFVSRKRGSSTMGSQSSPDGNECHLFADYETGYPADSVVNLINKILGENGYSLIK